jgi:SAM-dependent methyltransferase
MTRSFASLRLSALIAAALLAQFAPLCTGQEALGESAGDGQVAAIPPALETYLGRRIAQTMHYSGAPWLVRESREREEGTTLLLENLGVEIGSTICDLGCGNGFYSLQLAEMVGGSGRVIGVDIQPEMLELLRARAEATGIENIETVLGTFINPNLEAGSVDLAVLVDVYHEFSHPVHMLAELRTSLAPGGRIVLLEFRAEDPGVPIKERHKMSKEQIVKEMTANGFVLQSEFDGLPWQHMMSFVVDDERAPASAGGTSLFDGYTLNGWHAIGGGRWGVKHGVIIGTSTSDIAAHGLLVSDETYSDFVATFEYRVLEGDSGFYFRAEESGDAVGVGGFQIEIDDIEPGGLYETGGRGWVIKRTPEEARVWHKSLEWNSVKLVARGTQVEVYVNDHPTAVLDDPDGRREGHFALQLHGGQDMHVQYRNIEVQRE